MQLLSAPGGVSLTGLEAGVGVRSLARGRAYANGKRVLKLAWDPADNALTGSVVGTGGLYRTAAFFSPAQDGPPVFLDGVCTCPVGSACKHVAAIVIAAASGAVGVQQDAPVPPPVPPWEHALRDLVGAAAPAAGQPFAVELTLKPNRYGGPDGLSARLMRPGGRGGWVNGGLAWGSLESWNVRPDEYRASHIEWARELNALRQTTSRASYFSYSSPGERTIDFGEIESVHLWELLQDAAGRGIELVRPGKAREPVGLHTGAELVLDVAAGEADGLAVRPALLLEGGEPADLEPVRFLGAGHGLLCAERGADAPSQESALQLVRLTRAAPERLRELVLARGELRVPTADRERFADEHAPALRKVARVISSDASFTPRTVSGPRLVLRAQHDDRDGLAVAWCVEYAVGERTLELALGADGPPLRDHDAERALIASGSYEATGLGRFGLLDASGRPAAVAPERFSGLEAMLLSTEALPAAGAVAGVELRITGEPPDYRDVSEAVTIGVSTAARPGDSDWFDLGISIDVEGREVAFAELFSALASGAEHLLLDDGTYFGLHDERFQSLSQLIDEARALADSPTAPLRLSRYQAGLWEELAALGVVTEQAQAWQRQVGGLLALEGAGEVTPPAGLTAQLRPYQQEGFAWLATLADAQLGGILADDMGLGKTVQALAMICRAHERGSDAGPFLVVTPTSVVPNWAAEAARFAPGLRVRALTDTLKRAGVSIEEVAGAADVVVTTYTLFRLDAERLRRIAWAGLILDEAQHAKNHQSKTYKAARELGAQTKLAITGTPMENTLMELWSLLSITAPGLFPDPKRFQEHYVRPIEREGDAERLAQLRRRIKPLMRRRTKELVAADLPPKQEQTLAVELYPRHRKLYDTHLQRERQKILGLLDDLDRNRFTILRSITLLRQLSLHPGLVEERHAGVPCAKLDALVEQLEEVAAGGHRALVFSQFTSFLKIARARLEQQGIAYAYLDGSTRARGKVVDRFKQGDDPVFLISLKAGGAGLNLTEADYCFLLDPWWNPAVEAQAIDRTHRIGQTRPVNAYRLIAQDTIEEKVAALAQRKAALSRSVLDDGDLFASALSAEDIRGLLG